jgi:hypothetical protein
VVCRVVDRMTRPLQSHASCLYHNYARAYSDKGDFPSPWVRHAFIPEASHRGFCKGFAKKREKSFLLRNASYIPFLE